jgi:hypothetical protein
MGHGDRRPGGRAEEGKRLRRSGSCGTSQQWMRGGSGAEKGHGRTAGNEGFRRHGFSFSSPSPARHGDRRLATSGWLRFEDRDTRHLGAVSVDVSHAAFGPVFRVGTCSKHIPMILLG